MRERLAALAAAVAAAAHRRGADHEDADRLVGLVAALQADHPGGDDTGPGDPLDRLADVFDLSELDRLLLAIAVGPDLDANLGLAYGLLDGSGRRDRPSVAVALELAGVSSLSAAGRSRLGELAPLRWFGLLDLLGSGPSLTRQLRISDRVAAHLLGDDSPDAALAGLLAQPSPTDAEPVALLAAAVQAGVRLCWLRSAQGAGGSAVAAGAFRRAGRSSLVVDLATLVGVGEEHRGEQLERVVRAAVLEAGLLDRGLVLLAADALVPRGGPARVDLLDHAAVPVVAVAGRGWNPVWSRRIALVADAPRLDPEQRRQVWERALDETAQETGRDALTPVPGRQAWQDLLAMRLSPEEIHRTVRDATLHATVRDEPVTVAGLRDASRRLGASGGAGGTRSPASFDDLVLPPPALSDLHRLVSWARHRDRVLAQGQVQGAGDRGNGISALFGGNPGTGKTLAAQVISNALGLDLYPVDLSTVVDKYIGETEKNLERVFAEAEGLNVVLFFDEADSLFGSRSAVNDSHDRYANLEVSYLLQRMERFDGITVLATNLRGNMDAAFARRLQFVIHFPDPDQATRRRLWERHLSHVARLDPHDPPDLDLLAQHLDVAGGDIRNMVMSAAYDAFEDRTDDQVGVGAVGMRHLAGAAVRELGKLRRRVPGPFTPWLRSPSADGGTPVG